MRTCGPGIRPTKVSIKKVGRVTVFGVRKKGIIKKGSDILDHGQESPHGPLGVSHLTSVTYIFNLWSVALLTWHLVRSSDRNRSGDPRDEDILSQSFVVTCKGG